MLSILAVIDLQTGEGITFVRETNRSDDFIDFLKWLDAKYTQEDKIRIVLNYLQVHSSDKAQSVARPLPGWFEFVFTHKLDFDIIERKIP